MDEKVSYPLKIYYISDLHAEFQPIDLSLFDVKGDVLLLMGDILNVHHFLFQNDSYIKYNESSNLIDFFDLITNNFKHIIYVFGNHEYYLSDIKEAPSLLKTALKRYNNLHIVTEGELIEINDKAFVCGTCWTDYNKESPSTLMNAKKMINDYRRITDGDGNVTVDYILDKHKKFVKFAYNVDKSVYDKMILVTHHSPTFKNIEECFKDEHSMNGLFCSNLDNLLQYFDYAFHGHQHNPKQVVINGCKVLNNPVGYPNEFPCTEFKLKYIEI